MQTYILDNKSSGAQIYVYTGITCMYAYRFVCMYASI